MIDSYLKDERFLQQLKGTQSSRQGILKGYHLPIEGIRKGTFFVKMAYKMVRSWTSARSLTV